MAKLNFALLQVYYLFIKIANEKHTYLSCKLRILHQVGTSSTSYNSNFFLANWEVSFLDIFLCNSSWSVCGSF